jgi:hypothetical protein
MGRKRDEVTQKKLPDCVVSSYEKAQSAMEYLMTYGWSILIIAVVLGALFNLGIFSSANFAPKAQPGNCRVARLGGQTSLLGVCNGELPQTVAQFNGQSYVYVGSNTVQVDNLATALTVSIWANPQSIGPNTQYLFSNSRDSGGTYEGYNLYISSSGIPNFQVWNLASNTVGGGIYLSTNVWYQVVGTYDGSYLYIYVNGALKNKIAYSSGVGVPSSYGALIGVLAYNYPQWYKFSGSLANLQIYNTSLDANQISALYIEGIGGAPIAPQSVVGWWPLNGNATDYSGNNNNGAPTNIIYTGSWASGYTQP